MAAVDALLLVYLFDHCLKLSIPLCTCHQTAPTCCIICGDGLACVTCYIKIINSLWPRQNGRLFADDTFKRIFLNENIWISTKNSLKFVPKGLINNIPALVLIMAWRRPGNKPLSEPMMVRLPTHICVTRPQWVKLGLKWICIENDFKWSHDHKTD